MRNAATSPARCAERKAVEVDKTHADSMATKKEDTVVDELAAHSQKVVLEKSKSLSDSRPVRQLRTTRSLSPRPPMQHQQAIIVSHETDIVLHVTPVDCDDDEVFTSGQTNANNCNSLQLRGKQRGKARSEHTSPNLSCGSLSAHDNRHHANNRSTGCLVYVPSDPWIQLPQHTQPNKTVAKPVTSLDNDPWIQQQQQRSTNRAAHKSAKATTLNNSNCRSIDMLHVTASPRPKLQRTAKTTPNTQYDTSCCDLTGSRSPQKLPPPPPSPPIALEHRSRAQHFLLTVANNPNLQPRHSFSTLLPTKDDELQLNCRRLSEQVKTSTTSGGALTHHHPSATDFSSYLRDQRRTATYNHHVATVPPIAVMSAMTVVQQTATFCGAVEPPEPVLETTC